MQLVSLARAKCRTPVEQHWGQFLLRFLYWNFFSYFVAFAERYWPGVPFSIVVTCIMRAIYWWKTNTVTQFGCPLVLAALKITRSFADSQIVVYRFVDVCCVNIFRPYWLVALIRGLRTLNDRDLTTFARYKEDTIGTFYPLLMFCFMNCVPRYCAFKAS